MNNTSYALLIMFFMLPSLGAEAQTENYEKGLEALQNNRYHEAMVRFTKVVENEKFEVSGKVLSQTYAHLATIRVAYLKKDLENPTFNSIITKQGHIKQTIQELVRASKFQDKSTKSSIEESTESLIQISTIALRIIGDSLMTYDENYPNETTDFLAQFAIQQFGELEEIAVEDWELHDILGLAHYYLGEKDKAMSEFKKGRDQVARLLDQPKSSLHLKNFELSAGYYFKDQSDFKEAQQICKQGSSYTSVLINDLDDSQMTEILRLNKIENRFRQYITRIKESSN